MPFTLQPLPFAPDALEPHISQTTVEFHHGKHQQAYVDNLNKALEPYPFFANWSLEQLLLYSSQLPSDIRTSVRRNAGGVYNHQFYWSTMQPAAAPPSMPEGTLMQAMQAFFSSFDAFVAAFKNAAIQVFGSGYAWLVRLQDGSLAIITTANQDTPLPNGLIPGLCIDVWEHAYYLDRQNRRAEYIDHWFALVNWQAVARNLFNR